MSTTSSVADFSQPIYLQDQPGSTGTTAADSTTDPSSVFVDLNDPNLLGQDIEVTSGVDPYAAPPPVPDQRWRVKLRQREVKDPLGQPTLFAAKKSKDGTPYIYTSLEAEIIDLSGKFDKIKLTDYFVSTLPNRRNGARPMLWILECLGVKLPARITPPVLMAEFKKALASEPELEIETVWEGSPDQADQEKFEAAGEKLPRVMGQHRFPQMADGTRSRDIEVETKLGKLHLFARPRINGYFGLGKK